MDNIEASYGSSQCCHSGPRIRIGQANSANRFESASWTHVRPKWAQARNLGPQKNPKNQNSQNQNPFCPKCRQGFFMPEKNVPAPFGALPAHFLRGPEKSKKCNFLAVMCCWRAMKDRIAIAISFSLRSLSKVDALSLGLS